MVKSQYDIFISYSSKDLEPAQRIADRLAGLGFSVWFDKARLNPGCKWHEEIEAGVEASRIVLPLLTPHWKESDWTKFETYAAETIIPLIVEGQWEDVSTPPLQEHQSSSIDLNQGTQSWDLLTQAIHDRLQQALPQKSERIASLRYSPNSCFVGREADLIEIHESLFQNPTVALTQGRIQAIVAMGGVGKTTLAREYAEKFWRLYPQMFWVDARDPGRIREAYADIARLLFPALASEKDIEFLAKRALQELNGRQRRLLILDNVEDEQSVMQWIPKAGACHTIITSRFTGFSAEIRTHKVFVLAPEPARELLLKRAGRAPTPENSEGCDRLAKLLDYLPLALEQAAAYIKEEGPAFSYDDYINLYDEDTRELLAENVLGSTEYPDSVYTTWNASRKKLSPLARTMFKCSVLLAPAPIPFDLFLADPAIMDKVLGAPSSSSAPGPPPPTTEPKIRKARKELARYSLILNQNQTEQAANPGDVIDAFTIHALVRTVERLDLDEDETKRLLPLLTGMMLKYGPYFTWDTRVVKQWNIIAPHCVLLCDAQMTSETLDVALVCSKTAPYLHYALAEYNSALPLYQRALEIREKVLGPEHWDVAISLNGLGVMYQDQRKYSLALPLHQRALEIFEKVLGPEHPDVGASLNNLATYIAISAITPRPCLFISELWKSKKKSWDWKIRKRLIR